MGKSSLESTESEFISLINWLHSYIPTCFSRWYSTHGVKLLIVNKSNNDDIVIKPFLTVFVSE